MTDETKKPEKIKSWKFSAPTRQEHPIYLKPERLLRERLSIRPSIQEARVHPELINEIADRLKKGHRRFSVRLIHSKKTAAD